MQANTVRSLSKIQNDPVIIDDHSDDNDNNNNDDDVDNTENDFCDGTDSAVNTITSALDKIAFRENDRNSGITNNNNNNQSKWLTSRLKAAVSSPSPLLSRQLPQLPPPPQPRQQSHQQPAFSPSLSLPYQCAPNASRRASPEPKLSKESRAALIRMAVTKVAKAARNVATTIPITTPSYAIASKNGWGCARDYRIAFKNGREVIVISDDDGNDDDDNSNGDSDSGSNSDGNSDHNVDGHRNNDRDDKKDGNGNNDHDADDDDVVCLCLEPENVGEETDEPSFVEIRSSLLSSPSSSSTSSSPLAASPSTSPPSSFRSLPLIADENDEECDTKTADNPGASDEEGSDGESCSSNDGVGDFDAPPKNIFAVQQSESDANDSDSGSQSDNESDASDSDSGSEWNSDSNSDSDYICDDGNGAGYEKDTNDDGDHETGGSIDGDSIAGINSDIDRRFKSMDAVAKPAFSLWLRSRDNSSSPSYQQRRLHQQQAHQYGPKRCEHQDESYRSSTPTTMRIPVPTPTLPLSCATRPIKRFVKTKNRPRPQDGAAEGIEATMSAMSLRDSEKKKAAIKDENKDENENSSSKKKRRDKKTTVGAAAAAVAAADAAAAAAKAASSLAAPRDPRTLDRYDCQQAPQAQPKSQSRPNRVGIPGTLSALDGMPHVWHAILDMLSNDGSYVMLALTNRSAYSWMTSAERPLERAQMQANRVMIALFRELRNVALDGAAGTGKSHTIRRVCSYAKKIGWNVGVTSTTAISAQQLEGAITVHKCPRSTSQRQP